MDGQDGFAVGSYSKAFSYSVGDEESGGTISSGDVKPRILIMGLRRSGKSSIQKVCDSFTFFWLVLYIPMIPQS